MKGVVIALMVVAMVQVMVKPGVAAVNCGQVESSLSSCIPFLTGGGSPSAACCGGVKNLQAMTPTAADRQAACECVKAAAANFPNIKEDAASSLPAKCGISFNIPISKNTNCQNIN